MCWDSRFGKIFDTPFARRVRRLYMENNLLVFGVVGHIMSAMVFFDMVEKLCGGSDTTWSPLRLLGPPMWLPLRTATGKLMAAQTLVHSAMYFFACYYLVQSRYRKNIRLMGPWIVMHCFFMVYQIVLVMENRDDYELWEALLALSDFPVINVVVVLIATHTGIHWIPSRPPQLAAAGVPVSTELQPLYAHTTEENPESTGHSAETVLVTDEAWTLTPPPSYEDAVRTPSHATGATTFWQQENQGGAINVSWPWRWRLFREAARAAAAATVTGGIELQTLGVITAAQSETTEATTAAELQTSETGIAVAEPQPSSGSEHDSARRTGWLSRWRWRRLLEATRTAAEERSSSGGQEPQQLSAPRRRAVGGSEPSADQPLLQPSH
ncbi:uncharacterized protein LOC126298454 isoform X1 [Schistocerca gregaria]|uniref:uncharacterized protein LOC126298454 isoform X1 n=1 Tax=Schistocerca gregaria TaxID=7010 RepID=UPI00211F39BF|nr:uncharacterized protein LOC126298454 isoform X1 [Schistocerca gregaria]